MKSTRTIIVAAVAAVAVAFVAAGLLMDRGPQSARAAEPVRFLHSYAAARQQAQETQKPIFIHFTTDWCGWCRKLENEVYASARGAKALKAFVPLSLDCTVRGKQGEALAQARRNQQRMQKYGGRGYPFLVVLAPDGTVLHRFAGYRPLDEFLAELHKALQKFQQWKEKK